jgi:hypothetical protein
MCRHMGRAKNAVVSFCGTKYKNKTSLYTAVFAVVRDAGCRVQTPDHVRGEYRKNCAVPLGRPVNFLVSQLAHCGCAVCGPPCAQARTTNYSRISPATRPSENVHSKRHAASLSSLDEAFLLDKDGADAARDAERSAVALHDARATEPCCLV